MQSCHCLVGMLLKCSNRCYHSNRSTKCQLLFHHLCLREIPRKLVQIILLWCISCMYALFFCRFLYSVFVFCVWGMLSDSFPPHTIELIDLFFLINWSEATLTYSVVVVEIFYNLIFLRKGFLSWHNVRWVVILSFFFLCFQDCGVLNILFLKIIAYVFQNIPKGMR